MMTDSSPPIGSVCPTCGSALPSGPLLNFCPHCLWQVSLAGFPEEEADSEIGWMLGDYELFEEIARGGMGVVYRARQKRLDREVAVKVLRGGEFANESARRRFQAEATAVARLKHPGIVAIHDVGEDSGVPWFSMDYLARGNLIQRVGETPMAASEAAQCVRRIAEALQHAHDNGVLHRDLKPSNILLDDAGLPQITDFGIARRIATDANPNDPLTGTGQALGSPGYAAPELALGGIADQRTDVYGLGALLYYLLTARPPFQGPTLDAVLLQLRENEPVPPRRLNPAVPRDLETICLHALSKEPSKRYATAQEVADELERFLRGESIQARPLSPASHAVRWCRRHPGVAALGTIALLLTGGLIASGFLYGAKQSRLEHRTSLLADARAERVEATNGSRTRALADLREAWKIQPSAEIRNEAISCLAMPEITLEERAVNKVVPSSQHADETLAATFSGREVLVSNVLNGEVRQKLIHPREIFCLDWRDGLLVTMCEDRFIYIWDAATGTLKHRLSGHEGLPVAVAFRHNGQEFVSVARDGYLRIWQAARGVQEIQFDGTERHIAPVWWSDDDSRLYCTREDGKGVDVYRVEWPRSVKVLAAPGDELHTENSLSVALSPDGNLAATVDEHQLRIWDLEHSRVSTAIPKTPTEWLSARFTNDGSTLWVCGFDTQLLRLAITRSPAGVLTWGTPELILGEYGLLLADISADGRQLALAHNQDGRWLLLNPEAPGREMVGLPADHLLAAVFSPNGSQLATTSYSEPGVRLWAVPSGKLERELPTQAPVMSIHFTSDGQSIWVLTSGLLQRLNTRDWTTEFSTSAEGIRALTFSQDNSLAASQERGGIRLLAPEKMNEIARLAVPSTVGWLGNATLDFSANDRILAAHTALGCLVVWDIPALRSELRELGMDW